MKSMNLEKAGALKKFYEIFHSAALCIGLILLADSLFPLPFKPFLFILPAFLCQFFIHWSEEKSLRFQLWGSFCILLALIGPFLYMNSKNMTPYIYLLSMAAICVPVSVICYIARCRLWLKALICLLQLLSLIGLAIQNIPLSKWSVCLILFCFLLFLAELSCAFSEGKTGQKTLYLTPVFFLSALLLLSLPVKETPIRWNTVRNMIKAVREEITTLIINAEYFFSGGNEGYSLSFSGYSESGELKGSVLSSSAPQISIIGDKTKAPLYLGGNVHDFYNGRGWEKNAVTRPYGEADQLLQYEGLISAFSQSIYSEDEVKEFTNDCSYTITYEGLKTKSIFYAPFTERVILTGDTPPASAYGDTLRLSKAQGVGFTYRIQFMEINYSHEKMKQLLRGQAWEGTPDLSRISALRQRYIHENYTHLPDTLPRRIYSLAEEITSSADNDYDRLKAIENYLSKYDYTTSPVPPGETEDVVDYFLFQSKTGYCTYFASAMAVLGRCAGIPTRYVEGFVSNGSYHYGYRVLNLSGSNAHAWVEAYIDNIGWIPFEPTPRYYGSANTAWAQPDNITAAGSGSQSSLPVPISPPADRNDEIYEVDYSILLESGKNLLYFMLECLFLLIIAFFIVFLSVILRNRLRYRSYMAGTAYEKVQYHMKRTFYFGKLYGYPIENGETLSDYGIRAGHCLDTSSISFCGICDLYRSIRFGGFPATETAVKTMEDYTHSLQKQYTKQCGRMKRLFYYMLSS